MLLRVYNILLMLFCGIVPLVSQKIKVSFLPISADFVLGGLMILVGFMVLLRKYGLSLGLKQFLKEPLLKGLALLAAIFLVMSVVSVSYSMNKTVAITETARALEYVLMFYLVYMLSDGTAIKKSLKIFYVAMILAAIYGIIQYVFNLSSFQYGAIGHGRIFATFENPNYWGAAVNMVIFYPILNILEKRNVKINIGLFLIFFFNLFFSSNRGSWLGFMLGLCVIGAVRYRRLIYGVAVLGFGLILIPASRSRLLNIMNLTPRVNVWKTGWYMFMDHFWTGVGNGNYLYEYKEYVVVLHPELYMHKTIYSIHNSFLKMFAELGIFGGFVFTAMYLNLFAMVVKVYRSCEKYRKCALAFICFGAAYLFQNLVNDLIFIPQLNVFVWILTALLFKAMVLEKQESIQTKKR